MTRSVTQRTSAPAIQHSRTPAVSGTASYAVQLAPRDSVLKRESPTELFATCLALVRYSVTQSREEGGGARGETIDYGKLTLSQDGRFGVFNGFWWASYAIAAGQFWINEFKPPLGYEVVADHTVMIPRPLLLASCQPQRIGRARVLLKLFSLAGMDMNRRGRPTAQASYIRATTADMALRLWHASEHGMARRDQTLSFAMAVPHHWVRGVLDSPPIAEPLSHVHVARISR